MRILKKRDFPFKSEFFGDTTARLNLVGSFKKEDFEVKNAGKFIRAR